MIYKNFYLKYGKAALATRGDVVAETDAFMEAEKSKDEIGNLLDEMFSPKKYDDGMKRWIQRVSREKATNHDILDMRDKFETIIAAIPMCDVGIRDEKKALCTDLMNELVRQMVLECPERGVVLRRVQKELQITTDAWEMLCKSSFAFGVRKGLIYDKNEIQQDDHLKCLDEEYHNVRSEYDQLKLELAELKLKADTEDQIVHETYLVQEEIMEESNQLIEDQLEIIADPRITLEKQRQATGNA